MRKLKPTIESPGNPLVKRLAALKTAKDREATGEFMLEGENVVSAIPGDWHVCEYVFSEGYAEGRGSILSACAERADAYVLADRAFKKVSDTVSPQGILAVCRQKKYALEACAGGDDGLVLFGERIADPGNLGTLIRSAAAAGCRGVVLSEGCVSVYNPKTLRAAAGALFHLPIAEGADASVALEALRGLGYLLVAADVAGGALPYDIDFTRKCCLMIGNEANGLSEGLLARADDRVRIPMSPNVESLNASVACGVLLYEAVRQRLQRT